jgi:hypothetical protein
MSLGRQIFSIHAKKWNPPLPERLVTEVADMCVGYCGADLKVTSLSSMRSSFSYVSMRMRLIRVRFLAGLVH